MSGGGRSPERSLRDASAERTVFAYVSDHEGIDAVYLRQWPDSGRVWRVSAEGCVSSVWRRDARSCITSAATRP